MGESWSMNLLFVSHSMDGGGVERVIVDLLKAAQAHPDLKIVLALSTKTGPLLRHIPAAIHVEELGPYSGWATTPSFARALAGVCKTHAIDYIVSNMTTVNKAVLRARILRPSLPKVAVVEHTEIGRQVRDQKSRLKRVTRPLEISWLYRRADKIVTVSSGIAEELNRYCRLPRARMTVINNPVDTARLHRTAGKVGLEDPEWSALPRPITVSAGRLIDVKGFDLLIKAHHLRARQDRGSLVIFGDGPEQARLQRQIRQAGLEQAAQLRPFTDRVLDYMTDADLFVSTSQYEGFGNALIEALACGLPCVATATAGAREIARHSASVRLLQTRDPQHLANAIDLALSNPDRDEVKITQYLQSLTADQVLQRYLGLAN